ncbi:hypothetical protein JKP88DRAFT_267494 [Tribonema minus]|uniref:Uncharacterized protein n=1 Tax=Tribonema minus TaxID=303371 RepID=A0A835ZAE1_9STRA|nr:hypothetical protein JKP88DRAFT_267494 [Tribonema minus]
MTRWWRWWRWMVVIAGLGVHAGEPQPVVFERYVQLRIRDPAGIYNNNGTLSGYGASETPFGWRNGTDPIPPDQISISPRKVLRNVYQAESPPPYNNLALNQAWAYWGLLVFYDLVDTAAADDSASVTVAAIPCDDDVYDSQCPHPTCRPCNKDSCTAQTTVPYSGVKDNLKGRPLNMATSFIDLDFVYGRDLAKRATLRNGTSCAMKLDDYGLPLFDTATQEWTIADQRSAQLPGTLALHALLLREHNRRCAELGGSAPNGTDYSSFLEYLEGESGGGCRVCNETDIGDPFDCPLNPCKQWGEEEKFHAAKAGVTAVFQHMTNDYFVPMLLGLPAQIQTTLYDYYNSSMDPSVDILAAVALRWPYSALGPVDRVVDENWLPATAWDMFPVGTVGCVPATVMPGGKTKGAAVNGAEVQRMLREAGGANAIVRGMLLGQASQVDAFLTPRGDTSCLNAPVTDIQVARDFGVPRYNIVREKVLSATADNFWNVSDDYATVKALRTAYPNGVGDLDFLVGGLAEAHVGASTLGPLFTVPKYYPEDSFKVETTVINEEAKMSSSTQSLELVQDYTLSWQVDTGANTITFNAVVTGMTESGYLAIGLGDRMIGADIAFIAIEGGVFTISDRYATNNKLPDEDTALMTPSGQLGHNDLQLLNSTHENDSRQPTQPDFVTLRAGTYQINFFSGESTSVPTGSNNGFFAFHGLVMLFSWGLAAPCAVYVARYKKHWANWLDVHAMLASFAVEATLPIAIAAMASTDGKFTSRHGKIGLAIFCGVIVMFISGTIRKMGIENQGNKYLGTNFGRIHQINKHLHRNMGRCLVALAFFNVYLGLVIIAPDASATSVIEIGVPDIFNIVRRVLFPVTLLLLAVLFIAAEVHLQLGKYRTKVDISQKMGLLSYSLEQFNDGVMQASHMGEKWVIVNDAIVDVSDYMKVHPGGSKVLKDSIGTDITKDIMGVQPVGQGVMQGSHKHSNKAWLAIQANIVAHVDVHEEVLDYQPVSLGESKKGLSSSKGSSNHSSGSLRRKATGVEQQFIKFVLRSKKLLSLNSKNSPVLSFVFEPKDATRILPLNVGFYHKFRVVSDGMVIQRSYTPVVQHVMPSGRLGFEYYIRLYEDGQMSAVLAQLKVGDTVRIQGPFEIKEIRRTPKHIYMIAGGTGVTPMLQLVRCHINRQHAQVLAGNDTQRHPDGNLEMGVIRAESRSDDSGSGNVGSGNVALSGGESSPLPPLRSELKFIRRESGLRAVRNLATLFRPKDRSGGRAEGALAEERARWEADQGAEGAHAVFGRAAQASGATENEHDDGKAEPNIKSMTLLWQTHDDLDTFCAQDLDHFAKSANQLAAADPDTNGQFYYVQFASRVLVKTGITSPGGRHHATFDQRMHAIRGALTQDSAIACGTACPSWCGGKGSTVDAIVQHENAAAAAAKKPVPPAAAAVVDDIEAAPVFSVDSGGGGAADGGDDLSELTRERARSHDAAPPSQGENRLKTAAWQVFEFIATMGESSLANRTSAAARRRSSMLGSGGGGTVTTSGIHAALAATASMAATADASIASPEAGSAALRQSTHSAVERRKSVTEHLSDIVLGPSVSEVCDPRHLVKHVACLCQMTFNLQVAYVVVSELECPGTRAVPEGSSSAPGRNVLVEGDLDVPSLRTHLAPLLAHLAALKEQGLEDEPEEEDGPVLVSAPANVGPTNRGAWGQRKTNTRIIVSGPAGFVDKRMLVRKHMATAVAMRMHSDSDSPQGANSVYEHNHRHCSQLTRHNGILRICVTLQVEAELTELGIPSNIILYLD